MIHCSKVLASSDLTDNAVIAQVQYRKVSDSANYLLDNLEHWRLYHTN